MGTALAGFMGGTLMGLLFVTHMAILLTFRPPKALAARAAEGGVTGRVVAMSAAAMFAWSALGIAAAFGFEAMRGSYPSSVATLPSLAFTATVVWVTALVAIPASLFMRDRLWHLAAQVALIVGIFGWLVPNLVVAV